MEALLEIDNIEVVYNKSVQVLRGLSLRVPEGAIVALLGSNGAGKSTTLKSVSGLLTLEDGEVTAGEVRFRGKDVKGVPPERLVRDGLFHVMEGRRVFEDLTVEIMLDEPSLGLAPLLVEEIFTIVARINREQGTAILLVEQNAAVSLAIASYGYIMENGKIVIDGPADKLTANEDVQEFYLGVGGKEGEARSYRDIKHYKRRKRWLS